MPVLPAFAIPIGIVDLEIDSRQLVSAIERVRSAPHYASSSPRSVRGGYRSNDLMRCPYEELCEVRSILQRGLVGLIAEIEESRGGAPVGRPSIRELWCNVLSAGDYQVPHEHHPYAWAGVLYVRAGHCGKQGEQAGSLEIYPPAGRTMWTGASMTIRPVDGRLVVFPGALLHMVHPHSAPEPRYALAFNAA